MGLHFKKKLTLLLQMSLFNGELPFEILSNKYNGSGGKNFLDSSSCKATNKS